mmetsp:Transcript_1319/g.3793  ORF Transcript_1319/g.3793 Transcript_1319/m.3793 type:complete len:234 (+) Transcript_1319:8-709(+)
MMVLEGAPPSCQEEAPPLTRTEEALRSSALRERCAVRTQKLVRGRRLRAQGATPQRPERAWNVLAPFNPTPALAMRAALELLRPAASDVVYDLGCGDGRFLCAAATQTPALRVVGVEADPAVAARAASATADLERVEVRVADLMRHDCADATKLFLYLLPAGLARLRPRLDALRRTADVASYTFAVPGWHPAATLRPAGPDQPALYFYPAERATTQHPLFASRRSEDVVDTVA